MNTHTSPRIEFVIQSLRDAMPKRWPEISRITGVPEDTIRKIAYRETRDPRSRTLDALHAYFEEALTGANRRRKTDHQKSDPMKLPYTNPNGGKARESKGPIGRQPVNPKRDLT